MPEHNNQNSILDKSNATENTITRRVVSDLMDIDFEAINDSEYCFKYITENDDLNKHFKSFSDSLIETVKNYYSFSKGRDYSVPADLDELCRLLSNDLYDIQESTVTEHDCKQYVKKWLIEGKQLTDRRWAIAICFALKMNFDKAKIFFKKIGQPAFNLRSASDVVYLYCLINNKSYLTARKMLCKYEEAPILIKDLQTESGTSGTTKRLWQEINVEGAWATDDDFINELLIPNKSNFTGLSNTALEQYWYELRLLQLHCLERMFFEEKDNLLLYPGDEDVIADSQITKRFSADPFNKQLDAVNNEFGDTSYFNRFEQTDFLKIKNQFIIATRNEDRKKLEKAKFDLNDYLVYIEDTLKSIKSNVTSRRFKYTKCSIDVLLEYLIGPSELLSQILKLDEKYYHMPLTAKDRARFISFKESNLPQFFDNFLKQEYFSDIKKGKIVNSSSDKVRKAVLYLHFMNYVFEFNSNSSYEDFRETTNKMLDDCQLTMLYPVNQFDFLLLITIRKYELLFLDEDDNDTKEYILDYLYEILNLSFEH